MRYAFTICKLWQHGIDRLDSLIRWSLLSWKDREDHDFRFRQASSRFDHDGFDTCKDILRLVRRICFFVLMQVVGTNHQSHKLGGNSIKRSIPNAPENIVSAITGKAKVQQITPFKCARIFTPRMSNGVTDHYKIDLGVCCLLEFLLV